MGARGTLLGSLEASWARLGPILKKTLKKLDPSEANLGVKIDKKSKQIDVKKRLVLRDVLFSKFLEFSMDLGAPKPKNFGPIFAITPKMSNL